MNDVNTTWSVLSQGQPYGNPQYSRKVSPIAYLAERETGGAMLQALIPYDDDYLRAKYVEAVVQLLLKSPQRDRILQEDPINAYESARLQFPPAGPSFSFQQEPTDMRIYTSADEDVLRADGQGILSTTCVVDPNTNILTHSYGEVPFTVSGGLSSHIVLAPGLTIRLQSDFATVLNYEFTYVYVVGTRVDWPAMLQRAQSVDAIWDDPTLKEIWEQDPLWTNRLAAFATATVELFRRGSRTETT